MSQQAAFQQLAGAALTNEQKRAVKGGYVLQPGDQLIRLVDPNRNRWEIRTAAGDFIVEDIFDGG